jgi:hypothetical protein
LFGRFGPLEIHDRGTLLLFSDSLSRHLGEYTLVGGARNSNPEIRSMPLILD